MLWLWWCESDDHMRMIMNGNVQTMGMGIERKLHRQTTNTQYTVCLSVHVFNIVCAQTHTPIKYRSGIKHSTCRLKHRTCEDTYFCFSRASRVLLLRFCRLEGGMEWTEELFLLEEWEEWEEWDKLVRDWPALWSNCMRQKIRSVGTSSNSYGGFVITYLPRKQMMEKIKLSWSFRGKQQIVKDTSRKERHILIILHH